MPVLSSKTKKHAMKKLLTILLAAGMFSIYSCGSGSEKTQGTATDSTGTTTPAPAPAPAAADSGTMHTDSGAH